MPAAGLWHASGPWVCPQNAVSYYSVTRSYTACNVAFMTTIRFLRIVAIVRLRGANNALANMKIYVLLMCKIAGQDVAGAEEVRVPPKDGLSRTV